ncbi:MAG: hypothetical protein U5K31_09540 [Balneolaceae bacterium]|nr:hypothetical protein [Balneolaceae bacterium]
MQDFRLKRSVRELGRLVVTGEDPAVRIMREVIRRKQIWRANLENYQAEAYTRQVLSRRHLHRHDQRDVFHGVLGQGQGTP